MTRYRLATLDPVFWINQRRMIRWLSLPSVVAFASPALAQQKPGWTLTFDDEFDETSLDTTKWGNFYKWGQAVINGEQEAYTTTAFSFSNGVMSINATNTSGVYAGQTLPYSSGLIASGFRATIRLFRNAREAARRSGSMVRVLAAARSFRAGYQRDRHFRDARSHTHYDLYNRALGNQLFDGQ